MVISQYIPILKRSVTETVPSRCFLSEYKFTVIFGMIRIVLYLLELPSPVSPSSECLGRYRKQFSEHNSVLGFCLPAVSSSSLSLISKLLFIYSSLSQISPLLVRFSQPTYIGNCCIFSSPIPLPVLFYHIII